MAKEIVMLVLVVLTLTAGCYARSQPGPIMPRCVRSDGTTFELREKWTNDRDGVEEMCECVRSFNPLMPHYMRNRAIISCLLQGCERAGKAYPLGTVIRTPGSTCDLVVTCVEGPDPYGPMDIAVSQFHFKTTIDCHSQ
ncbi:unnamed protein product [Owenia fusiformis]|uniref:Uncharacterized protein n=1 Tax=Owenia fusiformis TaxID=6347 RepID=A0A8J1XQG0_OWEFU|nr:unnamed protein product [Owenia fusiformis]